MVKRAIPTARSTNAMPPRPIAFASVAAHNLLLRSFKAGESAENFCRNVFRSAIRRIHHQHPFIQSVIPLHLLMRYRLRQVA
jgi:hypothetical protein